VGSINGVSLGHGILYLVTHVQILMLHTPTSNEHASSRSGH